MTAIALARTPRQLDIIADTTLSADPRLAPKHTASSSVVTPRGAARMHTASSSVKVAARAGREHTASSSLHALIEVSERARIRRGMSHAEFCRFVGIELNNWHKLRRGAQRPSAATLAKLQAANDTPAAPTRPPQVVAAFHRLLMQMVAAQMGFDTTALLATDFSVQRPSNPQWLRAARIRQMAIYITAVELQVGNADLGRAIGDTRANILYARNAIEERREDGNEIDIVLSAVTLQVKAGG